MLNDTIFYEDHPKDLLGIPIPRINEFSKVKGYMINIQKSTVYLHVNNEYVDDEIKIQVIIA